MAKISKAPVQNTANAEDEELPQTAVKPSIKDQYIKNMESKLAEFMDPNEEPKVKEPPQDNQEEETFKKRYGDLRRFQQQKEATSQKKIDDLEKQIKQLNAAASQPMPKTQEEFEAWKNKYPDIATFIEIIADQKATQRASQLQEELGSVKEKLSEAEKDRAKAYLKALVPDYEELYASEDFAEWSAEQPKAIRETLATSEDPEDVAKVFNMYKQIKQASTPSKPSKKDTRLDALDSSVKNSGVTPSNSKNTWKYTQSQIQKMSTEEYTAKEADIDAAKKAGLILDDLSRKNTVFDIG